MSKGTISDKLDLSMFLDDYLSDAKDGFQRVNTALLVLEKDHSKTKQLDEIFRAMHTLKSSSTMLEFSDIAQLAHTSEDLLDRLRKREVPVTGEIIDALFEVTDTLQKMVRERSEGKESGTEFQAVAGKVKALASAQSRTPRQKDPQKDMETKAVIPTIEKIQTVRVKVDLLDALFNLAGELIINKNRLNNILSGETNKELKAALSSMGHIISDLQENVSAARLVPAGEIFQKFPRMMRDLAKEVGKEIELVVEGSEIELDKAMLDGISEPLIHMLKNALDHGIESPETRKEQNKKPSGIIKLSARRAENHILIDVEDDGSGIDTARISEVAVEKGLLKPEEIESLPEKDILNLIFEPGITGAEKVTDVSGRGVGLDVVKNSVKKLGGTVELTTQKGKGTRFTLTLPLTTAVLQTLMVGVGSHIFAIPTDIILETLEIKPQDIKEIHNEQALVLRQDVIPFVRLSEVLNVPGQKGEDNPIAVIIRIGDGFLGLGVDTVLDQTESIIKPFDLLAQQFKGFSGGTILGDGRVALLLDVSNLFGSETLQYEKERAYHE
ncbi:MAG: chemotaxis protein CheA [Dehalococcoidia bacterium]|nr:chemotaxis protein CheA [Dehalococcoidia bacterium]